MKWKIKHKELKKKTEFLIGMLEWTDRMILLMIPISERLKNTSKDSADIHHALWEIELAINHIGDKIMERGEFKKK